MYFISWLFLGPALLCLCPFFNSTASYLKIIVYVWVFVTGCVWTLSTGSARCWAELLASNGFVTSREHFSSIFEFFRLETIYFALRRLSIIYLLHCTAVSCGVSEQGDESIRYAAVCPLQLHSNERVSASASPKCAAVQLSILQSLCLFFCPLLSGRVCCLLDLDT